MNQKIHLIYGTGNDAKLQAMKRALADLPVELSGLKQAAETAGLLLPRVEEIGESLLENARIKAEAYYALFGKPVFSCDSGLYLWDYRTGQPLPDKLQPGIHVRGRGRRLTDEELIEHYTGLVKKYGPILGRYKNAVCLIWEEGRRFESMEEALWGEAFLFSDKPHEKRIKGFPLDSISLEISTGKYYYDLEDNFQDELATEKGFRQFFRRVLKEIGFCGE